MSTPTPPKLFKTSGRRPTPPKVLTNIRSMHLRRNAPPPIPIPINPIRHNVEIARPKHQPGTPTMRNDLKATPRPPKLSTPPTLPARPTKATSHAEKNDLVAVELSGYPPSLTRHDVTSLFADFPISTDFAMPPTTKFAYPLRTVIWIQGRDEAERAVRELDGTVVGNRRICVARVDSEQVESVEGKENEHEKEKEMEVGKGRQVQEERRYELDDVVEGEMADELKIGIVPHTYYPNLAHKVLEVREYSDGITYYAFLQAREQVFADTGAQGAVSQTASMAKWDFIAGGHVDARGAHGIERSGRLGALKRLRETMEEQGLLKSVWQNLIGEL